MKKTTDAPAYNVGDRVVYCSDDYHTDEFLVGAVGTVILVNGDISVGVEFDERNGRLHDCLGRGALYHCWFCLADQLRPLTDEIDVVEPAMELLFA